MPPEGIDSLNADSLKGLVLSLLAKIDGLVEQNKVLLARIAELEGRAGKPPKTPTNSSLPDRRPTLRMRRARRKAALTLIFLQPSPHLPCENRDGEP
jgi:hypothetical protein